MSLAFQGLALHFLPSSGQFSIVQLGAENGARACELVKRYS